jgi:2-methylcitrate dehydratase PrpD
LEIQFNKNKGEERLMSITDSLVEWAMSMKFGDISPANIAKAKRALLDSLGCMIGGSQTEVGQAVSKFISKGSVSGTSVIPGTDLQVSSRDSAFLNATLANALDYDDTYEENGKALCHPGATLISAALAASSINPVCGKDFLASLIVGYEVSARIGESVQPSPDVYVKVWGLNHFMVFGSVIVAARLLGLDLDTARNAFGIAGVAANVPSAWKWNFDKRELPLSWQKDMVSWPAEAGLRAALLADSGFRACLDILDGEDGFWRMCASDRFDSTRIINQLGEVNQLENLAFKSYPCCRWIHSILEAFDQAYAESGLASQDIQQIEVFTLSELANHFAVVRPNYMIDAEFSVPYTIAMVGRRIPIGPRWHAQEIRGDKQTFELASKVEVIASLDLDRNYFENRRIAARVIIRSKSGAEWEAECLQARGGKERPLSEEEHDGKVTRLIDPVLSEGDRQGLFSLISNLDVNKNVKEGLDPIISKRRIAGLISQS